jgi:hypothetical protein
MYFIYCIVCFVYLYIFYIKYTFYLKKQAVAFETLRMCKIN